MTIVLFTINNRQSFLFKYVVPNFLQWNRRQSKGSQWHSLALCRSSRWLTLASVSRRHLTLDTHDPATHHHPPPPLLHPQHAASPAGQSVMLLLTRPCLTHWQSQVRWCVLASSCSCCICCQLLGGFYLRFQGPHRPFFCSFYSPRLQD